MEEYCGILETEAGDAGHVAARMKANVRAGHIEK
jgi:hypothetical protein